MYITEICTYFTKNGLFQILKKVQLETKVKPDKKMVKNRQLHFLIEPKIYERWLQTIGEIPASERIRKLIEIDIYNHSDKEEQDKTKLLKKISEQQKKADKEKDELFRLELELKTLEDQEKKDKDKIDKEKQNRILREVEGIQASGLLEED